LKYKDLIDKVQLYENENWFGEFIYFKTLGQLRDVLEDIRNLKFKEHVMDVIRIFLLQWGQMARTVEREDTEWKKLTDNLLSMRESFQKLRGKSLLDDFDNEEIAEHIKSIYESAYVKNIVPTAISKILHLLNPDLFVMWDEKIREKYKKKNPAISISANGYLEFLKTVQTEVKEAIKEESERSGRSEQDIVEEICTNLPSKKLGPEYCRKTLAKLIDEYNYIIAR